MDTLHEFHPEIAPCGMDFLGISNGTISPMSALARSAGRCCRSQRLSDQPLSPFGSGNAFNLGSAECVEAVYQRHTDVDFGCLAIRIT